MTAAVRYARKRLDLTLSDVVDGLACCLRPSAATDAEARIAEVWHPTEAVLACLSVRSGLDLYLAAVDWPPGSEVLLSAITIPHLATLVRHHGYRPVGIDVDAKTMTVSPDQLAVACGPRTRALIFAQLFGARADVTSLAEICAERGITLIEDCAQCYDGAPSELGTTDVAMYSFGTIKTATCLGGAVLLIRDPALRTAMAARQQTYPTQSPRAYAAKLTKAGVLLLLTAPATYGLFTRLLQRLTGDYDESIRRLSRGFDDRSLLSKIRRQPSPALLTMMARRLGTYDASRPQRRRLAGERLAARLDAEVEHLGGSSAAHTHWLFPVVSRAPDTLVAAGRTAGFDMTRGSSTLVAVDPDCIEAARAMRNVVYLPAYHPMPAAALTRLADLVNAVERE